MKLKKIYKYLTPLLLLLIMLASCQKKDDRVHIKFSTWGSESEINILKPLIKEFEQNNPDIHVELLHIPQNYFQKLHMMVAANLSPDVIFVNNLNIPVYASGNIFKDLTPILRKDNSLQDKQFFNKALEAMTYNKKLMAIPRDVSNVVIYYNKDLFLQHGIKEPQPGWTFDDFLQAAQNLTLDTNKDRHTDIFGISFETLPIFYFPFIWSNGGHIFNEEHNRFILAENNNCQTIQYYADLRNKYHVAPTPAQAGNSTMAQMFIQGKLAMLVSGRWSTPKFRQDIPFNWDIINFPAGKAGSVVGADGSGWAMYSKTKHPQEAWKLIQFLASKEAITKFTTTGLIVPARKDVAFSQNFLEPGKKPESSIIFLDVINNARPTPKIQNWNEVADLLNVTLEPVWNSNKSACKLLKGATPDINELLQ